MPLVTEANDYRLATAPINRSHSPKLPRKPNPGLNPRQASIASVLFAAASFFVDALSGYVEITRERVLG
jgi:hypothetical protein